MQNLSNILLFGTLHASVDCHSWLIPSMGDGIVTMVENYCLHWTPHSIWDDVSSHDVFPNSRQKGLDYDQHKNGLRNIIWYDSTGRGVAAPQNKMSIQHSQIKEDIGIHFTNAKMLTNFGFVNININRGVLKTIDPPNYISKSKDTDRGHEDFWLFFLIFINDTCPMLSRSWKEKLLK